MIELEQVKLQWVVPEKIHTPPTEEISAIRRGRGEKIVSDNSKCIRTSEGGRGVNFLFPLWGWYGCFWNDPMCLLSCLTPEFFLVKGKVLDLVFERVKDAVQSDLRMCTKEPSFYLQTVYLGFYFILCSCKA
jgi:hypothetical protein